jgi:thioredoxin reductase (NADPH)
VDGFELGLQMKEGAERFGAETVLAEVFSLKLEGQIKEADTSEGIFRGRTVVFATGANPKNLGVPEEQQLTGKGLHYCAHCDGMFYRNKTVMVVGGGNTAAADALLLSRIAKKVILVHRRDALRATKIYHEPLKQAENVEFIWNSSVSRLLRDGRVNGAVIRNLQTGEETEVAVDGIFVSIGRVPATALVKGQLALDDAGYIIADESTKTNIPGVFAVGDVRTKALRQIVTAVSDGAIAAHYADEYLAEQQ